MTKGRRTVDPETGLTANMESFCVELVKTDDASGAYRKAYDAKNMKPDTISKRARELQLDGRITARLKQLRAEVRKTSRITLEEHLGTLRELRQEARAAMQYSAAITAEVSRGKVSGLYDEGSNEDDAAPVHRVEIVVKDGRKV